MIRNLLLYRMRNFSVFLFGSLLALMSSCNSSDFEEHQIGDNLIDKSTEVILIDTFMVRSSTVKRDSVVTSGYENVLFGQYTDEYFGKVRSEFYAEVGLGDAFSLRKINLSGSDVTVPIKYDSLVFIGYGDGRYYGDTLVQQSIEIHRVTEEIKLPEGKFAFYGHDSFDYDSELIGQADFFLKPKKQSVFEEKNDSDPEFLDGGIRFRMQDLLGEKIIEKVNAIDDTVLLSDRWRSYFKGFLLKPGIQSNAMFAFALGNAKMKMRLYYSDANYDQVGVARFHDFPVNSNAVHFSNYQSDKSLTPQGLGRIVEESEDLISEETDNLAFIQGGIGFLTKIRIPYITGLNKLGLTGGILKAELVFYPKDGSYNDDQFMLPQSPFNIFETDETNQLLQKIVNSVNNNPITSIYYYNTTNKDESFYSVELTDYINRKLLEGQKYDDALLISLPFESIGNSMERMVIENDINSDFRIKLKVTYVVQK